MIAGKTFGLIGSLKSYPRRALAKEVVRQGGEFQHRVTRRTSHVVFGKTLLDRFGASKIKTIVSDHRQRGKFLLSENAFLRDLGLLTHYPASGLSRQALVDQSKLRGDTLDLLALFDAFESHVEPFSFRDLILAKKYADLVNGGMPWLTLTKSLRKSETVASLTSLTLKRTRGGVVAQHGDRVSDLAGQALFDYSDIDRDLEDYFVQAEEAEEQERFAEASILYAKCLAMDASDAVTYFNHANCLVAAGDARDAELAYLRALKLDPKFAEAWFNLSRLVSADGNTDLARRYLAKAIGLDEAYADAVFNLARLEFDTGHFAEAKRLWSRYLELDNQSDWAKRAIKGIQYIDLIMVRDGRSVSH